MKSNKTKISLIFLIVFLGIIAYSVTSEHGGGENHVQGSPYLEINNIKIPIEIVDTEETRRLGLSYRESLEKDSGMLFVMPSKQVSSYWMKDMNFPLDIIWIDGERIVNISRDLPPGGSHPDISYSSDLPVDYVLEVNGGFCDKSGIKIDDRMVFNINNKK